MVRRHRLLDAIRPQARHLAADVDPRLVERIAEVARRSRRRRPGCRSGAMKALMWPTEPFTTMAMPFIEMPQREEASPSTTSSPPRPEAPAALRAVAGDVDAAGHHVLGHARPGMAVDRDRGLLVHAAAVEADMPVDRDLDRPLDPDRDAVRAHRVDDRGTPVSLLSARSACRRWLSARTPPSRRSISIIRPAPAVDLARRRLPHARRLGPRQAGDGAVLGRHRHPVVGLGQHRRACRRSGRATPQSRPCVPTQKV